MKDYINVKYTYLKYSTTVLQVWSDVSLQRTRKKNFRASFRPCLNLFFRSKIVAYRFRVSTLVTDKKQSKKVAWKKCHFRVKSFHSRHRRGMISFRFPLSSVECRTLAIWNRFCSLEYHYSEMCEHDKTLLS